jgi:hypothetical protein
MQTHAHTEAKCCAKMWRCNFWQFFTLTATYGTKFIEQVEGSVYLDDKLNFLTLRVWVMVVNNISVISWQSNSISLVEETGVPGENHRTLSHNVVSSTPGPSGILTHNFSGDKHSLQKYCLNLTTIRWLQWHLLFLHF